MTAGHSFTCASVHCIRLIYPTHSFIYSSPTPHNDSTRRSDATFLFKKVLTQGALAALDAKGAAAGGKKKGGAPLVSAAAMASVVVRTGVCMCIYVRPAKNVVHSWTRDSPCALVKLLGIDIHSHRMTRRSWTSSGWRRRRGSTRGSS